MSCQVNQKKIGRGAAKKSGIPRNGSQNAFLAGNGGTDNGAQLSFFASTGEPGQQTDGPAAKNAASPKKDAPPASSAPKQWEIEPGLAFTPPELQKIWIELALGGAAAKRWLRQLNSGLDMSPERRDPRPADWTRLDRDQFLFLDRQMTEVRRGRGTIDVSLLKRSELKELWEFARFEADRAHRNIDHLSTPGGPFGGPASPTSQYLVENHKLMARFFSFLAGQIEPVLEQKSRKKRAGKRKSKK